MVGRAPLRLDLEEALGEQDGEHIPVVRARSRLLRRDRGSARQKECGQVVPDVIALDLLEAAEEGLRPGQTGDGVVRLVSAKAKNGLGEIGAKKLLVLLIRE